MTLATAAISLFASVKGCRYLPFQQIHNELEKGFAAYLAPIKEAPVHLGDAHLCRADISEFDSHDAIFLFLHVELMYCLEHPDEKIDLHRTR